LSDEVAFKSEMLFAEKKVGTWVPQTCTDSHKKDLGSLITSVRRLRFNLRFILGSVCDET